MILVKRGLQVIVGISQSRSEIETVPDWSENRSSDGRKTENSFDDGVI